MSQPPTRPTDPPRFPKTPPLATFLMPALLWGLVVAVITTGGFATLIALLRMLNGAPVNFVGLASGALLWTALLFLFLGGLRILSYSRPWQDRAFTITGFFATFFGLAMLVIFFVGIGQDVGLWFRYIPRLIEKQNADTLQAREDLKNIEKLLRDERTAIDKEYSGAKADLLPLVLEALAAAHEKTKKPGFLELKTTIENAGYSTVMIDSLAALLDKRIAEAAEDGNRRESLSKQKAELLARRPAAEKAEEAVRKELAPLILAYRAAVKSVDADYAKRIAATAKEFKAVLDDVAVRYAALAAAADEERRPGMQKRVNAIERQRKDFDGAGAMYVGTAKFLAAFEAIESAATHQDEELAASGVAALRLLTDLKHLNDQKSGNDGIYAIEQYFQEAMRVAPDAKVRDAMLAIRRVQEKHDGKEGIFRTKARHDWAMGIVMEDKDARETLEMLTSIFGGFPKPDDVHYEGFRGSYETKLMDFQTNYVERKKVADLPLRDPSAWCAFWHFMFETPSNAPQDAGIWPALLGSFWIALITILFAVPVGVGAALYLEEYKHSGWLGHIIQVNINNLAGVPSVVYSILGAFIFVDLIFRPLSQGSTYISPRNVIGGGLTLGLLTLPVVIVSAQEAIKAVPNSIRQGAYALGATHWQVIWRQVLPLARPGILTGTILAVSRAIGEAAPLVLFGALQFVDIIPGPFTGFTVMPMQIYNWAERPYVDVPGEADKLPVWHYNAALASLVLLVLLLLLNATAIWLRNRAQKKMRV